MSKSNERIIAKMKKLLAMSNSKGNENEAMIAARQLHSLLIKHSMEVADLDEEDESIGEKRVEHKDRPWKRTVGQSIARLYFCDFYYMKGYKSSTYVFVGKEADRLFATGIFAIIITTIEREARKASKEQYGKEVCSFVSSFWAGAMRRIVDRCGELIQMAKEGTLQDEEGNNLPVMLDTYDQSKLNLKAYFDSLDGLKTTKSNTKVSDSAGFSKGKEAGDRVQLSRALQGDSSPKLLN